MYKGKAHFHKHVLALIPQLQTKQDGVQQGLSNLQEFPSLQSSKGN